MLGTFPTVIGSRPVADTIALVSRRSYQRITSVSVQFSFRLLHNDVFTTLGITLTTGARSLPARGDMLVAMMQLSEAVN